MLSQVILIFVCNFLISNYQFGYANAKPIEDNHYPSANELSVQTTTALTYAAQENLARQSTSSISWKNEAVISALFVAQAELPVTFELVKPAMDLAIIDAKKRYPKLKFKLNARKMNTSCFENRIAAFAAEDYFMKKVSVFIGPACSLALDPVARMAAHWNVPVLTAGGIGLEFAKKDLYTSLTRMAFSLGKKDRF